MLYRLREFDVSSDTLDPRLPLAELVPCSSGPSFNLNGLVSKDCHYLFRGEYAVIYSGILYQRENQAGILGGGPSGARNTTKVLTTMLYRHPDMERC